MNQSYRVLTEAILERAIVFARNNWQAMAGTKHPLVITFAPEKSKRSLEANRYYWAMLRQIEEQAWLDNRQYASEIWHECAKRKFIGLIDIPGGGTMAMSSTDLSVQEFATYVQQVESWAASELGVTFTDLAEPPWRTP